jgi:hypothetical protein
MEQLKFDLWVEESFTGYDMRIADSGSRIYSLIRKGAEWHGSYIDPLNARIVVRYKV